MKQVASEFEDSAIVVGALKFRLPVEVQAHEQILW